jgi:hypothetical protein
MHVDFGGVRDAAVTHGISMRCSAKSMANRGWLNAVDPASLFALIDGNPVANPAQYLEVTGLFSMGPTQAGSLIESFGVPVGADLNPSKAPAIG